MEVIALRVNRNIRSPQWYASKLLRVFEGGQNQTRVRTQDPLINFNYIKVPIFGCFRLTKMSISYDPTYNVHQHSKSLFYVYSDVKAYYIFEK